MNRMFRFALAVLVCGCIFCPSKDALAQTTRPATQSSPLGKIDADNLGQLPVLASRRGAISVGVDRETLENAPESLAALRQFVGEGGVVLLHTDAAQLFGFRTVFARQGSNSLGGQLLGRARAALPFGSHPLLNGNRTARSSDPARLPGVNVVYYTLREGDVLVTDHPAGTGVLEVSDLSQNVPANRPLYACAMAPYGQGWAVVVPESIDLRRGEGALFSANLRDLFPEVPVQNALQPNGVGARSPKWIGIPQTSVADGANLATALSASLSSTNTEAPALPAIETVGADGKPAQNGAVAPSLPVPPVVVPAPAKEPALLIDATEARAILARLQTDPSSVLPILRARVAILNGDYTRAQSLMENVPESAERSVLQGIIAAGGAAPLAQSSTRRSGFARQAGAHFARASTLRPIFSLPAVAATSNASAVVNPVTPRIAGLELAAIRGVAAEFSRLADLFSLEPPSFQAVGSGHSQLIFRFFEGDVSSPALLTAATALADARVFGWRVDSQEILVFPDDTLYGNFKRASGQTGQNVPFPAGAGGDVVGARILLVALPAAPVIRRLPNGQTQILPPRSTGLQVLARLQAYALLSTWLDGGGRVPAWLALGLENLAAGAIGADTLASGTGASSTLQNFAAAGGLLTSAQFEAQRAAPSDIAQLQSAALMAYFYRRFGAGAVTETVQRLGAGQAISLALTETTGADENALFQSWRSAQFGPQNFPNRG